MNKTAGYKCLCQSVVENWPSNWTCCKKQYRWHKNIPIF